MKEVFIAFMLVFAVWGGWIVLEEPIMDIVYDFPYGFSGDNCSELEPDNSWIFSQTSNQEMFRIESNQIIDQNGSAVFPPEDHQYSIGTIYSIDLHPNGKWLLVLFEERNNQSNLQIYDLEEKKVIGIAATGTIDAAHWSPTGASYALVKGDFASIRFGNNQNPVTEKYCVVTS